MNKIMKDVVQLGPLRVSAGAIVVVYGPHGGGKEEFIRSLPKGNWRHVEVDHRSMTLRGEQGLSASEVLSERGLSFRITVVECRTNKDGGVGAVLQRLIHAADAAVHVVDGEWRCDKHRGVSPCRGVVP